MVDILDRFFEVHGRNISDKGLDFIQGLKFPITEDLLANRQMLHDAYLMYAVESRHHYRDVFLCHVMQVWCEKVSDYHNIRDAINRALDDKPFLVTALAAMNDYGVSGMYQLFIPDMVYEYVEEDHRVRWHADVSEEAGVYASCLLRVIWIKKLMEFNYDNV